MISRLFVAAVLLSANQEAFAVLKVGGAVVPKNPSNPVYAELISWPVVAGEIVDAMIDSTETFSFTDTNPHAYQHFRAREEIARAIDEMSADGEIDFFYSTSGPTSIYPGNGVFDALRWNGTRNRRHNEYSFITKPGVSASAGITAICTGTTRSECLTALCAAILIGHQYAYGSEWIDNRIAAGQLKVGINPYFIKFATDGATRIMGDHLYMINKSDYKEKAEARARANGIPQEKWDFPWQGENCICTGHAPNDTRTVYSGLGRETHGKDEAEFQALLAEHYLDDTGIEILPGDIPVEIYFVYMVRIAIP